MLAEANTEKNKIDLKKGVVKSSDQMIERRLRLSVFFWRFSLLFIDRILLNGYNKKCRGNYFLFKKYEMKKEDLNV